MSLPYAAEPLYENDPYSLGGYPSIAERPQMRGFRPFSRLSLLSSPAIFLIESIIGCRFSVSSNSPQSLPRTAAQT